jgi:hypothetical protein
MYSGTAQEFKRKFETPILRGRDSTASDGDHKKGMEKLQEVYSCLVFFFVIIKDIDIQ